MLTPVRASVRQRDRAIRTLGTAYREGMLSTGTFELRIDAALRARTVPQLREIVADLPGLDRLRAALDVTVRRLVAPDPPIAAAVNLVLPGPEAPARLRIGRHGGCDVVFTDASVSRQHALLRRERDRWVVHDLASTNGTWLNGERIERHELTSGDQLAFGALVTQVV